jgi:acetate kinase
MACSGLAGLGIVLDPGKNARAKGKLCRVESDQSQVKILVVPTNEERAIARQTLQLLRAEGQIRDRQRSQGHQDGSNC